MFENDTFENILGRMLDNVPSDIDKREGSIIYDALAPAAVELTNFYIANDGILQESFADTATREYLKLRAKEQGIYIKSATYAYYKGEFNVKVPISSRFNANGIGFTVTEPIEEPSDSGVFTYMLMCDVAGTIGNNSLGDLVAIDYVAELSSGVLTELLIPGENEEDTESFRQRYFDKINKTAFGGNRDDYIQKVKEINGVGEVKAFRTPNGGGTVKVIITDTDNNVASKKLISTVKEILDPTEYEGLGFGVAPIGHKVIVSSATPVDVDISLGITTENGNPIDENVVIDTLKSYISSVNNKWENKSTLKLYVSQVIAIILDIDNVIDVTNVLINGNANFFEAKNNEIFRFNSLNVG